MDSIEIPIEEPGRAAAAPARLDPAATLIGESAGMRRVAELIGQVGASDATSVLILGESGTGKELVAKGIHQLSARAARPFVPVNCGAIPGDLLESELFGHEKGAFTGALSRRRGRFELAHGGTLFLDEIGDMPMAMQVKLLRVLQEHRFERVGGSETMHCDVRVVAATHRDVESRIASNEFREDLFYRLNVFPIEIPPLRERPGDIPLLIEHFRANLRNVGGRPAHFSSGAMALLEHYPWPGNVRELGNLVERMSITHAGREVGAQDLPARYRDAMPTATDAAAQSDPAAAVPFEEHSVPSLPSDGIDLKTYLANLEIGLVRQSLQASEGNVSQAARLLGLRRTTLVEKMKKYDLEATDF